MSDVSVSKRKNGKWEVRWRDSSGRRRSRSVTFKRDADRFATEIRRQQQVGNLVDLERGLVLLADFVVEYWRDYAIPNLAPRTRDVYGASGRSTCVPGSAAFRSVSSPRRR
jgi:hypothetical protein